MGEIDAAFIGRVAIRRLLARPEGYRHQVEGARWITMASIDKAITQKRKQQDILPQDDADTRAKIEASIQAHPYLREFTDVFSKRESD
jgi:hypothetical protein